MSKIKLPGTLKKKKILLAILVVVSILVIIKFGLDNRKNVIGKDRYENQNIEHRIEESK